MHDDVEPALVEHTGRQNGITGWHAARGLMRECARTHAHHDQCMPCHEMAQHGGMAMSPLRDRRRRRTWKANGRETQIRARLTVVSAQSSDLHGHGGRWRRVGDATREQELVRIRKAGHNSQVTSPGTTSYIQLYLRTIPYPENTAREQGTRDPSPASIFFRLTSETPETEKPFWGPPNSEVRGNCTTPRPAVCGASRCTAASEVEDGHRPN